MTILIVSGSYYPDKSPRSFRTTELARELVRQGHRVDVFIPQNAINVAAEKESYNVNVHFLKPKKWKTFPTNGFGRGFFRRINRVLELFFEYPAIETKLRVFESLKDLSMYDLLISIAYPHMNHWGCAKLFKRNSSPCKCWIADCGDPYMGTTMLHYKHPFYFKYVEKNWCKLTDYITVPIEGAIAGYYKEFRNKIHVIPQGFRMDNLSLAKYAPNKIVTLAYSGGVGLGPRNPLSFIDYLLSKKYHFRFVIYTNQFEFFDKYKNLDCIELHEYIPREQLLFELSKMDFLINLDNGTERQMPSKLIDYAITGRPILNVKSSDLNMRIIDEFMAGDYSGKMKVQSKEEYDIVRVAERFIDLANQKL